MLKRSNIKKHPALSLLILLCLYKYDIQAQITATREYQVKAVFRYNFSQFVQWPENTFNRPEEPFVIGILGADPFGKYLDETVKEDSIAGHVIAVRRYNAIRDIKNCQILYMNVVNAADSLQELAGRSILTVSDVNGFATTGGMIGFITQNNKIRFQINLSASKAVKLMISSKLLRLANIVD